MLTYLLISTDSEEAQLFAIRFDFSPCGAGWSEFGLDPIFLRGPDPRPDLLSEYRELLSHTVDLRHINVLSTCDCEWQLRAA